MNPALVLCIPGPWANRTEFIKSVAVDTGGAFIFAGKIMLEVAKSRHVEVDVADAYPEMREAFRIAGQGRLPEDVLSRIETHRTVIYLTFPIEVIPQRETLMAFTGALHRCGGFGVKVESSGVAHTWDAWDAQMNSEKPFDWYRTFVCLIGDQDCYYSCGMHHFGLPDVEVTRSLPATDAAELMNRFNMYQIVEEPKLQAGHTFSLAVDSPRYRLHAHQDARHDDLFRNPRGLWRLEPV